MSLCYDYFHGTQGDTGFTDLFSGYDIQVGDNKLTTPVVYMNLNKIKTKDDFAYWNPSQKDWIIESGKFEIMVGASSSDIMLKNTIEFK